LVLKTDVILREDGMAGTGQATATAVRALLKDAALAGDWTLDPTRSTIGLRTRSMWGLAPVKGGFRQVSGRGTVSADGEASGTLTVAAGSIDTKNAKRDKHLRSADFFGSAKHPDITFTADSVRPSGQGVAVSGTLTVRGRTRPLSFEAKVSALGSGEARLEAEVQVNRADFGLTWNQMGMASMNNTIIVHAVFTRS
jgi:polyisoprenoid-binding protein YceI